MSFTRSDFMTAVAAPVLAAAISVGFPANANAADNVRYIEPSTADLSQPVDACVKTTQGRTAYSKLQDILERQGQVIAVDANKMGVDGKGGLSSTKVSVAKNLSGRDGYIIESSYPKSKNEQSDGFCLSPMKFVIARPLGAPDVPSSVNRGEMGVALTNQAASGSYTVVFGKHAKGAIFSIHFNPDTNQGRMLGSDGYGNGTAPLAILRDLEIKEEFKSLLASAPSPSNKPPVTVAAAGRDIAPR